MGISDFIEQKKRKMRGFISSTTETVNAAKIGRFATKLAENAAAYVVQEGYKHVPGGNAVANVVSKTLHDMKSDDHEGPAEKASNNRPCADSNNEGIQAHNIAKEGLKDQPLREHHGTNGIQAHNIAKEGLKDQSLAEHADGGKKPSLSLVMDETLATRERTQDDMNCVKQENKVSTQCEGRLKPMEKFSDETIKSLAPLEAGRKRVSIPSRL